MSTAARLMTAEELWLLSSNGTHYELIEGVLQTMPPAGFDHGATGNDFSTALNQFVKANKLGVVVGADVGFVLARNPDTIRSPGVAFVRGERVPTPRPVKFWEGAPDLAVEVVSPSDTVYEVDATVQAWLDGGAREVIVINPRQRTLTLIRPGGTSRILAANDTLADLETVPGFQCLISDLFA